VSQTYHLVRRNGVWHYRRRVPTELVESLGRKEVQFSLGTRVLKEAKTRRAAEDLKWDIQFERASRAVAGAGNAAETGNAATPVRLQPLTDREAIRLVQAYVEETDERARGNLNRDPPESDEQQAEMIEDAEYGRQILRNRSDPRSDERISRTAERILRGEGLPDDGEGLRYVEFAELVRRGCWNLTSGRLPGSRTITGKRFLISFSIRPGELTSHSAASATNSCNLSNRRLRRTRSARNGSTSSARSSRSCVRSSATTSLHATSIMTPVCAHEV
jgi:Domain of unknown function (DUF6538)